MNLSDQVLQEAMAREELRKQSGAPPSASSIPVLNAPMPGEKFANRVIPSTHQAPLPTAEPLPALPGGSPATPQIPEENALVRTAMRKPTGGQGNKLGARTAVVEPPGPSAPMQLAGAQLAAEPPPVDPMQGVMTLQMLHQMFPNHVFTPVNYDPYAVLPKGGSSNV